MSARLVLNRRMSRIVAQAAKGVAVLLLWLATLCNAQAFVSYANALGQPQKWSLVVLSPGVHPNVVNPNTHAIRYYLAADAYSTANKTAELNAARACFDQWQAVANSHLRFEEGGLMPGKVDVNTGDNTNVIFWAKSSTMVNGGLDNIAGTTGVTFSDFFSNGTLAEADIVLNGVQFTWFTDFADSANQGIFVESVLLHEIGHFLGLAHSPAGASTMFPRGGFGTSVQAGLSIDEIAAVHALYPSALAYSASLAGLTGLVSLGTAPVLGAIVTAEDAAGNLVAGTVTRANGRYEMKGLPPGSYQLRVSPADPANASYVLFRGADVTDEFAAAEVNFLPTPNSPVTVAAGATGTLNFTVTPGSPAFRIGRLLPPTTDPSRYVVVNYPTAIPAGATDVFVGVYSSNLPSSNAVLRVTGTGLNFGQTTITLNAFPGANPPLHLLSVPVHLTPLATPGLRSLVVQQETGLAYANGFVEIAPAIPDYNFDGFDDRFQRQYFPRWTAPEAAAANDPDHDGFTNEAEYWAATNPVDATSVLRVESVRVDASGATVTWPSAPGKRYQVLSRPRVDSARGWQTLGSPVISDGNKAQYLDTTAGSDLRFYRIQALPN